MNLVKLNKICFTVCVVSIALGAALSLVMIWGDFDEHDFLWRIWLTLIVLFLASCMTLFVSKALGGMAGYAQPAKRDKPKEADPEREDAGPET